MWTAMDITCVSNIAIYIQQELWRLVTLFSLLSVGALRSFVIMIWSSWIVNAPITQVSIATGYPGTAVRVLIPIQTYGLSRWRSLILTCWSLIELVWESGPLGGGVLARLVVRRGTWYLTASDGFVWKGCVPDCYINSSPLLNIKSWCF